MRREDSKFFQRGCTKVWWKGIKEEGVPPQKWAYPPLSMIEREKFLATLDDREVEEFFRDWRIWGRDEQLEPPDDYDLWLLKCGRGWGKTRTAVETILDWVRVGWARRIAIVGQGEDDIRSVMIEGQSGFLECSPSWNRPAFYPSKGGGTLIWPNGCQGFIYSAVDTEGLRGPEFNAGWFDEPMAVPRGQRERAMDNLDFCLRLVGPNGEEPKLIMTTTPKPDPWIRQVVKDAKDKDNNIVVTEGSTYDNEENLSGKFVRKVTRKFGGTRKGRQEIEGKILGEEEGTLWPEEVLDRCREGFEDMDPIEFAESCEKVMVGVDPNTKGIDMKKATSKKVAHAAGIVVVGKIGNKRFVLADCTVGGGPAKWAKAAVLAALKYDADEFTAEGNQGGQMVKIVLEQQMESEDFRIPVHINWSKRSKQARAEPVSTMYERGEVHHVGPKRAYEDLELQMMYLHEEDDPTGEDFDRVDGLVSAMTRLGVKRRRTSGKGSGKGVIRTFGDFRRGANQEDGLRGD